MGAESVVVLAVVVLVVGGVLAIPAGPARPQAEGAGPTAASYSLVVNATADYTYQPATFQQVPTDTNITVTFTDKDPANMPHTLNISGREGFKIPTTYTAAQLNALFTKFPGLFNASVSAYNDQVVKTFLSPSEPGWYEFICNVTGHFQNGMYGFIAFGENLPPNLTPPSRVGLGGATFSPLDAAVLGGVLVVVLAGIVVWRRSRSAP
jgi:plastocyanin